MSLMSALYVGNTGLTTSQNAVNTVAHNLSNIDTTGYTRQQVLEADKRYIKVGTSYVSSQQVGLGVSYAQVRQVRDYFLDRTYRLEAGRTTFYENSYNIAKEVETLFGEMEGVEFQNSLNGLWTAAQELQKDPSNATNQGLFVSSSVAFIERAQAVYDGLASYQDNLNLQIKDVVGTINDYGHRIQELNIRIAGIEAGDQEKANDLRDERNQLIDELAAYGKVTVDEDAFGSVTVQFENRDFITRTYVNELECQKNPTTGFYSVVWSNDCRPDGTKTDVFNFNRDISTDTNTDIGGLKSLLLLRGDDRGTYVDIPKQEDYYSADGSYNISKYASYLDARDAYDAAVNDYNHSTGNSFLKNTMAEFDALINGIVTQINDLLNPTDASGNATGISLFLRKGTLDEEKSTTAAANVVDDYTAADLDGDGDMDSEDYKIWKQANKATWYTVSNLKVNPYLLQQYSALGAQAIDPADPDTAYTVGFTTIDGKENRDLADKLAGLFDTDFSVLNPNQSVKSNYVGYYNNLVSSIAITGNIYKTTSESQDMTLDSVQAARQTVIGVSDNEELTNMIMYQNAYNASSRYINAVNEMLTNLLNNLAG